MSPPESARKTQRDSWQRGASNEDTNNGYAQARPLPNTYPKMRKTKPIPNAKPISGVTGKYT